MKDWQTEFDEGAAAFDADPGQSVRGRSDVFRQGFYSRSCTELLMGYTHVATYEVYVISIDKWVHSTFRTTADAVRLHRRALVKNGARNISFKKIKLKGK